MTVNDEHQAKMSDNFTKVNRKLFEDLRKAGHGAFLERVFNDNGADVDMCFMGFVAIYAALAEIIPKDRVIYDMGCAYAFQSWYFRDHKRYVGVDFMVSPRDRLFLGNAIHHNMTIKDFVKGEKIENPHFAICSYVPPWHGDNEKIVRDTFRHMFIFYPEGE